MTASIVKQLLVALVLIGGLIGLGHLSSRGPGASVDGRPGEAESDSADAVDTLLLLFGDGLARIGELYLGREYNEEAASLFWRVAAIRERLLGPNHPESIHARARHAEALRRHTPAQSTPELPVATPPPPQ